MTLKKLLSEPHRSIYLAFWPDGTQSHPGDEDYDEKCERYAEHEADLDTERDYDEKGCNWGLTFLYVYEEKAK